MVYRGKDQKSNCEPALRFEHNFWPVPEIFRKSSMRSLNRMPGPASATIDASVALRTASGSAPQAVAVQLDEVEGVEEYALQVGCGVGYYK